MELRTYFTIIARRKWIIIFTAAVMLVLVGLVGNIIPLKYSATAWLWVKTPIGGSPSYVDFNIWYADRLMNTYAYLATISSIKEELKSRLNLFEDPDFSVSVVPSSELIRITAKAGDPTLSADIANTMAEIIIENSQGFSEQSGQATLQFLSDRQTQVIAELKAKKQIYSEMIKPIAKDQAKIGVLSKNIDQDNQLYITLRDNYEQNVSRGASKEMLTENERQMSQLQDKIEMESAELEKLNAQVTENIERLEEAKRQVGSLESELDDIQSLLDQTKITEIIQQNTFAKPVIDPAIPPPLHTNMDRLMIYAIGIVISLSIAIFFAFIVDNLDNRLLTTEQILSVTQLPLIGAIPTTHSLKRLSPEEGAYWEAMRRLRITLERIAKEKILKSLVICSASPREGKSTLLASLGIELALSGKKTVVVDTDIRKPTIHRHYQITNDIGLINYLTPTDSEGGIVELEQVLHKTNFTNLQVIPSGPILTIPTGLLLSPCMARLVKDLTNRFDWVLFDAPSLLAISDIDELAIYLDASILVIERGHSHKERVKTAISVINNLDTTLLGVLINKAETHSYYRYYNEKFRLSTWLRKIKTSHNGNKSN